MNNNANFEQVKNIAEELNNIVNGAINTDDGKQMTLYDYFEDVLDFNYIINADKSYRGARVLIGFGGPNIYLDTLSGNVELYTLGDQAEYPLKDKTIDAINDYFEELYNCY